MELAFLIREHDGRALLPLTSHPDTHSCRTHVNQRSFDTKTFSHLSCVPPALNCLGSFVNTGTCSKSCGSGGLLTQTYQITRDVAGGGVHCPTANGATQAVPCNTQPCRMLATHTHTAALCLSLLFRLFGRRPPVQAALYGAYQPVFVASTGITFCGQCPDAARARRRSI